MRRVPIAHIIFPKPNATRPVHEFAVEAAQNLASCRGLDVELLVPFPHKSTRSIMGVARKLKGAAPFTEEIERALLALEPRPTLIPYVPFPRRSVESATTSIAAALIARRRAGRPRLLQGSFLDMGGFAAAMVARAIACPSIAVAHGTDVRVARRELAAEAGRHRRADSSVRHASKLVAVSAHLASQLADLQRSAEVIHFGADEALFPLRPLESETPRVLFVGHLSRLKGVDLLLEAIAALEHSDAHLDLVGARSEDLTLEKEIARLGLTQRVTIHPEQSKNKLADIYARASCLALPSRSEGLGCVLVESLLVGRPVVATDVGGPKEIVTDEVGRLVPPEDVVALTAAIDQILRGQSEGQWDPKRLRSHGLAFAWGTIRPKLEAVTWEALESPA